MKRFFLPLILLMVACAPSKVEKLISDYEQTNGSTKTDLSLKIQELKEIGKVTGADSAMFYQAKVDSVLKKLSGKDLKSFNIINQYLDTIVDSYTHICELNYTEFYAEKLKYYSETRSNLRINNLEALKYGIIKDSVFAVRFDCTYTIKNPVLNNVKQTIKKTYYISSDLSKIISTSTI